MIAQFPAPEDRAVVQTAVSMFLRTQKPSTRLRMLQVSRAILDRYGVSKMAVGEYTVQKAGPLATVVAKNMLPAGQRICPDCGTDIYKWPGDVRILGIREGFRRDLPTYGCRCGSVFKKSESSVLVNEGGDASAKQDGAS
ncbi:MAG: hypothetical protein MJA84_04600 [Firmicutes bacterium]|nr:hypothetical protein [Bacillota bacterium]